VATIDRATQQHLEHIASLAFGLYAWVPDTEHTIDSAGSGIMIARQLALTAKHVTDDMLRLDTRIDVTRLRPGTIEPQYSTLLYQVPRRAYQPKWGVVGTWPSDVTDIALLEFVPDGGAAELIEPTLRPLCFEWQLAPPPVGSEVKLYGFPKPDLRNDGRDHAGQVYFVEQDGVVEEIFEPLRTHGMLEFPCYCISKPVDHGFSGGPVFWNDALVGIVSAGSSFDNRAWIASLWPLTLLRWPDRAGGEFAVSEMLDSGQIRARDWPEFKGRIEKRPCRDCPREHAWRTAA
jgi:hypothetical protein